MGILRPFRVLYVQVLLGIALGVVVGLLEPKLGEQLKPLADGFIKLIKLGIAPIIFCTVASGMARMSDLKAFGRLGAKTLLYFEAVSTVALVLGLAVGHFVHPGAGFNADPKAFDPTVAQGFLDKPRHAPKLVDYILSLIPETFFGAFAEGQILQILVIAILTGFACTRLGAFGEKVAGVLEDGTKLFSGIIRVVVVLAPIGAFGAMAYTVGKFGLAVLAKLAALVATFYATSIIFVVVVLGLIAAAAGFSIFKFVAYIREELLIVLGTSSSETVLPQIILKLRRLGAGPTTVGLVVPAGYSFNLDGTNIYMTLATLFLAQATNTPLTWSQELTLLGVAMLTSKGASGVTGAGFVTLAATLAVAPTIPIAALALIVGVDRFMSECRALTNLVGNGVAALVMARWEGDLDRPRLAQELARGPGVAGAEVALSAPAD